MTTATKKRPAKKKAKAKKPTTKKKKASARGKKTKKPSWLVLTYGDIEKRRVQLGLSKAAMATALEVTNSTYHNWRRGTTVPHPTQQEAILRQMLSLQADDGSKSKGSKSAKKKKTAKGTSRRKSKTETLSGRQATSETVNIGPGTPSEGRGDVVGGATWAQSTTANRHPISPPVYVTVPGQSVASATAAVAVAFIGSHDTAPSAGSILQFIRDVREVLVG